MKHIATAASAALLALGAAASSAPAAQAADFCAGKINATTYYERNFSYGGGVVATICAPSNVAGTAYLYARGSYANVKKYMKLTINTYNNGSVSVDGDYYSYVYRARPAGLHDYHAIMFDGQGHKIVDGWGSDYD